MNQSVEVSSPPAAGETIRTAALTPLVRLLAVGQLVLVAATWKLWTPQTDFPQVPLLGVACAWPGWLDWACLAVLIAASLGLLIVARPDRFRRQAAGGLAAALAGFFVLDQHRLQPWAWQFFLLALLLALADQATVRRGWIALAVSIYFWSAVSKLDYTFCHDQGPALLGGLRPALGLSGIPNRATELFDVGGSFVFALGELAAGLLLAWPRTRWLGLLASTAMHLTLLAALGPFGLNHSHGVLLWNVYFIAQNWLLFSRVPVRAASGKATAGGPLDWIRPDWQGPLRQRLAVCVIGAAIVWPVFEPLGLFDHWLAWAVYSARPGTSQLLVDAESVRQLAERQSIPVAAPRPPAGPGDLVEVRISQWSLRQLGVPTYPQHRFQVGVAWGLAEQTELQGVLILGDPPDRWTGKPGAVRRVTIRGTKGLESLAGTFTWNARPRRGAVK